MSSVFDGTREAKFRERSNNASMASIAIGQSFMCKACGLPRNRIGRKPMVKGYSKAGYKCAGCAAEQGVQ